MPIFEYRCTECGAVFEELAGRNDPPPPCPSCAGKDVTRLVSASSTCVPGGFARSSESPPMTGGCKCGSGR
ncbi:FmdB family zinc ribbon protein [Fundidesulfovibrio butyratiphilus]